MEHTEFNVLLIEDSPGDARLIQLMLSTACQPRYRVHHVERLSAGVEHIARAGVDAVLLDLSLPDSQGLDTFRAVYAHAPDLPVVVLSGLDDESLAIGAVQAGAQDYLIKGRVEADALLRSLRYAIERGRVERERVLLLAREQAARSEAEAAVRALETRARQQAMVARLGQAALTGAQIAVLMSDVVEAVASGLGVEYAAVLEAQPDGELLLLRAGVGWRDASIGGPAGRVSPDVKPVLTDAQDLDARFSGLQILRDYGVASGVNVPVHGRERPYGLLGAYTAARRAFTPEDVDFLRAIANILAVAIVRKLGERESAALHRAALAIGAELNLEARLDRVLDAALDLIAGDRALLGLIRSELGEVELVAARGDQSLGFGMRFTLGQGLIGTVAATNQAMWIDDLFVDSRIGESDAGYLSGARSWLGVPLADQRGPIGLLVVLSSEPNAFGQRSAEVLASLAALAAAAHREAQLRLEAQESETRYHSIFDGVTDAILVSDDTGCYIDANRSATELFGYSRHELLQMRIGDLSLAPREQTLALFSAFRRTGHHAAAGEIRRKDGAVVPVVGRGTKLRLHSGPVYVGIVQDVSEQLALERMRREFIAMVTHDLRNPLTSIRAYAQLMLRRQLYDERGLGMVLSQTDHLGRLLNDLMDVVRSETGQLELRRQPINLQAVLQACVEQAQAGTRDHTVRLDVPETPLNGFWDRDRLEQILRNLLVNAIKYSGGGEILVRAEDVGPEARVSVRDEGRGISPELQSRLFDRFSRGPGQAQQIPGLGLGLYITRMLIEAHRGRIWVTSQPGRGSTFTFTLPYGPDEQA